MRLVVLHASYFGSDFDLAQRLFAIKEHCCYIVNGCNAPPEGTERIIAKYSGPYSQKPHSRDTDWVYECDADVYDEAARAVLLTGVTGATVNCERHRALTDARFVVKNWQLEEYCFCEGCML